MIGKVLRAAAWLLGFMSKAATLLLLSFGLSLLCALAIIVLRFDGDAETSFADCALVFGAAVYGRQPGPAVTRRVATAAALYKEGRAKRLFLSGGSGGRGDGPSEADVMRREALRLGVQWSDISVEEQSRSTFENLLYARPLMQECTSTFGVSDRFHLARIRLLADQMGWRSLRTLPVEDRPPAVTEMRSVFREVLGYVYYAYHIHTLISLE